MGQFFKDKSYTNWSKQSSVFRVDTFATTAGYSIKISPLYIRRKVEDKNFEETKFSKLHMKLQFLP